MYKTAFPQIYVSELYYYLIFVVWNKFRVNCKNMGVGVYYPYATTQKIHF